MNFVYVVVGGGIAGVECAETLAQRDPTASILLVSESCLIKSTINLVPVTKLLTKFDVCEIDLQQLANNHSNIVVLHDSLAAIDSQQKFILTSKKTNEKIFYNYLCLCTGARPKTLPSNATATLASKLLTIRDTDSVDNFMRKIRHAKRIAIIGNGGIASELIFKCNRIDIEWIIRDDHISATFIDAGASEFLLASNNRLEESKPFSKCTYIENDRVLKKHGAALGPNWYRNLIVNGSNAEKNLQIHYNCAVRKIEERNANVALTVTKNAMAAEEIVIGVDLVIVAIGVEPKFDFELIQGSLQMDENGVFVNEHMETSIDDIFAAGDICNPKWTWAPHWFPMKLWTQAKQMGHYAAKCMIAKRTATTDENLQDFCFELFSHSTKLFGYDIVLLGLFNGQKLRTNEYDCLIRCTPGNEYIKLVISRTDRRLIGAILIGDCSMAETFENLILNRLDVSIYGDDLLNPDIDIDDYFD